MGERGVKQWERDKEKADELWPEIKSILQDVAGDIVEIKIADEQQDQRESTDYEIILVGGRVAARVRKWAYFKKYGDFTLRCSRPSGRETEYAKIMKGWGDWYLYGWRRNNHFGHWVLIDLEKFRNCHLLPHGKKSNYNGSSNFHYWPLDTLRKHKIIIKEKAG